MSIFNNKALYGAIKRAVGLICMLALILNPPPALAKANDSRTLFVNITGTVKNERGEPLAGVTVTIKGTNTCTATDENGVFRIKWFAQTGNPEASGSNAFEYSTTDFMDVRGGCFFMLNAFGPVDAACGNMVAV
ncbi:carboxypeptidase-like regulatory domain-containing protein [Parapedobacter tibetensis]|uniref:carboxypeptidase-like regulatory domain-containing protein n=1 Tax=Parapedobacter tibetensis TaxID=2972951 RepID=UPI00214DE741|nr:carboxypeptidase-like regulatory domain-containing protein [Parapedobacter tibetensis]